MTKLLLISLLEKEHRHLGCLALFAYLKNKGRDIELLFIPDKSLFQPTFFLEFAKSGGYGLIGISVVTQDYHFASSLTQLIHNELGIHVLWGGIHPTTLPGESLQYADFVCSGKGEEATLQLLDRLDSGITDYQQIQGISFRNSTGVHIAKEAAKLLLPLDEYPHPYYDWRSFFLHGPDGIQHFTFADYQKYSKHNGDSYSLMTSFSCPFNCSYCINSFLNRLYQRSGKIERRGVQHVISEIKDALEHIPGIHFVNFLDDQFLTDEKWLDEFLDSYEQIKVPFIIRAAPRTFDRVSIQRLKDVGLQVVQMGIQSGSERTHQAIFHRHFNLQDTLAAATILSETGVKAIYDIIIENEFEDESDRNKTLELILQLRHPYSLSLFSLTPFPGTEIIEIYKKRGITPTIDPYSSDYTRHESSSFSYRLATIIPHLDHNDAIALYAARDTAEVQQRVSQLYDHFTHGQKQ